MIAEQFRAMQDEQDLSDEYAIALLLVWIESIGKGEQLSRRIQNWRRWGLRQEESNDEK